MAVAIKKLGGRGLRKVFHERVGEVFLMLHSRPEYIYARKAEYWKTKLGICMPFLFGVVVLLQQNLKRLAFIIRAIHAAIEQSQDFF